MGNLETMHIDCQEQTTRDINNSIREAAENKVAQLILKNTQARHNIGVGILKPIHLIPRPKLVLVLPSTNK